MLVVISNAGDWDIDMLGVVGVINDVDELQCFAEQFHQFQFDKDDVIFKFHKSENVSQRVEALCDKYELSFIAEGMEVGLCREIVDSDTDTPYLFVAIQF